MENIRVITSVFFFLLLTDASLGCCEHCKEYRTISTTTYKYVPHDSCRSATVSQKQSYTVDCGWWGSTCTKYRTTYKTVSPLKCVSVKIYRRTYNCNRACDCDY